MLAVDADAADIGRQMNDHGRIGVVGIQARHRRLLAQIVLGAARHDDAPG